MIEFRELTLEDEVAFKAYLNEWDDLDEIVPSATNFNRYLSYEDMVKKLESRKVDAEWIPNTTLFYFVDGVIVGAANVRHHLNEQMIKTGGHIGYGVGKSYRKQGYATKILAAALEYCKTLGLDKVLVTCDEDNIGSSKVILNNGGVEDIPYIQSEPGFEEVKSRRFWIEL